MINYMLDSSWGYLIWNNYKVTRVIFQFLSGFKPRVCCIKTDADIKVRTNRVLSRNPSCLVQKKKKKKENNKAKFHNETSTTDTCKYTERKT